MTKRGVPDKGALVKADERKPVGRPSKASMKRAKQALNEKQQVFVWWLATPEAYRKPDTQRKLAQELGVHEVTLTRWASQPKIIQAVRWVVVHKTGDPYKIGQVVDWLHELVLDDGQRMRDRLDAAREYLAATGVKQMWKDPVPDILNVQDVDELQLDDLTDEELWDLYQEREKQLMGGEDVADDQEDEAGEPGDN